MNAHFVVILLSVALKKPTAELWRCVACPSDYRPVTVTAAATSRDWGKAAFVRSFVRWFVCSLEQSEATDPVPGWVTKWVTDEYPRCGALVAVAIVTPARTPPPVHVPLCHPDPPSPVRRSLACFLKGRGYGNGNAGRERPAHCRQTNRQRRLHF